MTTSSTFNSSLALSAFVLHIVGNFALVKPNPKLEAMLESYSFMPPFWVFSIWIAIWSLQGILIYKTFGSAFWTNLNTSSFLLVCIGNLGSQVAGANGLRGWIYLSFLACMLLGCILFMKQASQFAQTYPIANPATQLYAGWASLAFVVGLGAVLVAEQKAISDANYAFVGSVILAVVPILIWILWLQNRADYRVVSVPYALVILAFSLRLISS